MVILDDHLTLLVLAGGIPRDQFPDRVLTVSLWYLRLVAAVTAPSVPERGPGRLTRLLDTLRPSDREAALARILEPPAGLVEVLHPMRFAVQMARVQRERHLNLLAAEKTIGAAVHHEASIVVAAPNSGGPIEQAALADGVSYSVRTS